MQIPVVIEELAGNRFRAKSATAQGFAVEAATVEESLLLWRERFAAVLPADAEVVRVESAALSEHPLTRLIHGIRGHLAGQSH